MRILSENTSSARKKKLLIDSLRAPWSNLSIELLLHWHNSYSKAFQRTGGKHIAHYEHI